MRKLAIAILYFGMGVLVVWGRIGETFDQCEKRYGQHHEITYDVAMDGKTNSCYVGYIKAGYMVGIRYLHGKAAFIAFEKKDGGLLSESAVETFLKTNGENWEPVTSDTKNHTSIP